jgi:hypothetical protein
VGSDDFVWSRSAFHPVHDQTEQWEIERPVAAIAVITTGEEKQSRELRHLRITHRALHRRVVGNRVER